MNLVLCDDEPLFLSSIRDKIIAWSEKTGHSKSIMIHSYTSSEEMLDAFQHGMIADALFLDIQIPGELNGLAVAKEIYKNDENIPIVFITSYGEYAEEGYYVNALRYLRKPVSQSIVFECMDMIWRRWELSRTECLLVDLPTQLIRLPTKSILYLEVSGHYCIIYTTDHCSKYTIKKTLDDLQKKLPEQTFVRCHRSYVVNLMYIRYIAHGFISMANGVQIPIGRVFRSQLLGQFRQFYLGEDLKPC